MAEGMPEGLWKNAWQPPDKSFMPLTITQKTKSIQIGSIYRVYDVDGGCETVEACSALDAAHKSSFGRPARIVRAGIEQHNVYYQDGLTEWVRENELDSEAEVAEDALCAEAASEKDGTDDTDDVVETASVEEAEQIDAEVVEDTGVMEEVSEEQTPD